MSRGIWRWTRLRDCGAEVIAAASSSRSGQGQGWRCRSDRGFVNCLLNHVNVISSSSPSSYVKRIKESPIGFGCLQQERYKWDHGRGGSSDDYHSVRRIRAEANCPRCCKQMELLFTNPHHPNLIPPSSTPSFDAFPFHAGAAASSNNATAATFATTSHDTNNHNHSNSRINNSINEDKNRTSSSSAPSPINMSSTGSSSYSEKKDGWVGGDLNQYQAVNLCPNCKTVYYFRPHKMSPLQGSFVEIGRVKTSNGKRSMTEEDWGKRLRASFWESFKSYGTDPPPPPSLRFRCSGTWRSPRTSIRILSSSMVAGRNPLLSLSNKTTPSNPKQPPNVSMARNLGKSNLGGVIFGCKNSTMRECLFKQLFGLPAQHFSYVKNIDPGLPLFLFNYSDRKLHGIFEAASSGQMNINPYAWTSNGSDRTLYPAQVQIRVRLHCQPLIEDQFKPIILDSYYTANHFWFELDHAQTCRLMSKLSAVATAPSSFAPQSAAGCGTKFRNVPLNDKREEIGVSDPQVLRSNLVNSHNYSNQQLLESPLDHQEADREAKDIIYMKLKELALNLEHSDASKGGCVEEIFPTNEEKLDQESLPSEISGEKSDSNSGNSFDLCNDGSIICQLLEGLRDLCAFKEEQIQKSYHVEQKLLEAEKEISQLKNRVRMLELNSNTSMVHGNGTGIVSYDDLRLNFDESIFLVGGYDGVSWLSALDLYSPSLDVLKSLTPMNCVRSYSSVVKLNGELYVFGGGTGSMWYDTVESYNPANDKWSLHSSLNKKKGSLAAAVLDNKIFVTGGGNAVECFSDVEMYDINIGRWIYTQSMLQQRFALATAELNGALYAVGGYDGKSYLKSAERFDPREHSWSRINSMNTTRSCHSLLVWNEKLYALGGYDGSAMSRSVEIYDPRLGKWISGNSMNQPRGYSAAAVLNESIYMIGGVSSGECIIDTIECYKEDQGWQETNLRGTGKRCFFSAIVLDGA